jgi:hypothetical protein
MLEDRIKSILIYLHNKEREYYTGGIRMGFEDGRPVSFVETTCPDKKIIQVDPLFNIDGKIRMACTGKFYGTLFVIYANGKITHFYYNQTWQGRLLEEMLERDRFCPGAQQEVRPKTRFTVAVRK